MLISKDSDECLVINPWISSKLKICSTLSGTFYLFNFPAFVMPIMMTPPSLLRIAIAAFPMWWRV
jgi:hypothetical protein